jgi:hypothetical protein
MFGGGGGYRQSTVKSLNAETDLHHVFAETGMYCGYAGGNWLEFSGMEEK